MLSESQKAALRRDLDVDALDRLLSRLPDMERECVLRFFSRGSFTIKTRGPGVGPSAESVPQPSFTDPELQSLFDSVSAPIRAAQMLQRRPFFPGDWIDVERRFALLALDRSVPRQDNVLVMRRPAEKGHDVIVLPTTLVNYKSAAIGIDALMSKQTLRAGAEPRVERLDVSGQPPPGLSDEGRSTIEFLVEGLSYASVQQLEGIGHGRWIDAWLLGSP